MCERLLANGVIEDFRFEIDEDGALTMRWGVVTFPGSNDDRDALRVAGAAARRRGGRRSGTRTATCDGVDCVVLPGGFSYGDYLRCGAMARFSPIMRRGRRVRRSAGGLVLGICNGFQILCEAGLLPGALVRNRALELRLRARARAGRGRRHAVHRRLPARRACSRCRSSTARAATSPTRRRSRALEADAAGRPPLRRRAPGASTPEANPNGSLGNDRRHRATRAATSSA